MADVGLVMGSIFGGLGRNGAHEAGDSRLHRRPRMPTEIGPHGPRLIARWRQDNMAIVGGGGQASCKQHAFHAAMGRSPTHHSLRYHLTPAQKRCRMPWCIQWGPTRTNATSFCIIILCRRTCVCVVCRACPHCGVGCGACWAEHVSTLYGCFRVYQRQRTPRVQPCPPAQTLPCVSQMHFKTCVKCQVAEGWG
jgi:hypothetical protein